jgi:hypothetical protein
LNTDIKEFRFRESRLFAPGTQGGIALGKQSIENIMFFWRDPAHESCSLWVRTTRALRKAAGPRG